MKNVIITEEAIQEFPLIIISRVIHMFRIESRSVGFIQREVSIMGILPHPIQHGSGGAITRIATFAMLRMLFQHMMSTIFPIMLLTGLKHIEKPTMLTEKRQSTGNFIYEMEQTAHGSNGRRFASGK